jgi:hypothetical protein
VYVIHVLNLSRIYLICDLTEIPYLVQGKIPTYMRYNKGYADVTRVSFAVIAITICSSYSDIFCLNFSEQIENVNIETPSSSCPLNDYRYVLLLL